jgi:hypothetical protein
MIKVMTMNPRPSSDSYKYTLVTLPLKVHDKNDNGMYLVQGTLQIL